MLLINLFGAPGAGKSTMAARIFSELKDHGINAELVTEFAKDKVWEESKEVFNNQIYILGKQYFRITRCEKKVDVIITDSPVHLSGYYNKLHGTDSPLVSEAILNTVKAIDNKYKDNSLNFFVVRGKKYNPIGRFQTEEESDEIAIDLEIYLHEQEVDFECVIGNKEDAFYIVDKVLKLLEGDLYE